MSIWEEYIEEIAPPLCPHCNEELEDGTDEAYPHWMCGPCDYTVPKEENKK